jgi:hypothetical protein
MTRLFALAEEVAPLLTGQWRYNRLAEKHSEIRHVNEAVVNDDTQPGRQLVFRSCWETPGRLQIRGNLPQRLSRVTITVAEQRTARAIAADINRRLLPGFLQEWQHAATQRHQQDAELELYGHQVELLRKFVPEFHQLYTRTLTGADEFYFRDGSVRLYASTNASLRLSLPFPDLVRALMALYGAPSTNNED